MEKGPQKPAVQGMGEMGEMGADLLYLQAVRRHCESASAGAGAKGSPLALLGRHQTGHMKLQEHNEVTDWFMPQEAHTASQCCRASGQSH